MSCNNIEKFWKIVDRKKLSQDLKNEIIVPLLNSASEPTDIYRNTLDPFSAVIDSMINNLSLKEWLKFEALRQNQKTLQNKIGDLHEIILGNIKGTQRLPVGNVIDLVNQQKRIIAEIKNKWNTTKGNHKMEIYDSIKSQLETLNYQGYTGYLVEILPKNKQTYDRPFTPSDNTTGTQRPVREDIRQIDGKTFYEQLTGIPDAINIIYTVLPILISEILIQINPLKFQTPFIHELDKDTFWELFYKVF